MARKQKLLFKPTPISRLLRYTVPLKMVGDPPWNWTASGKSAWSSREKAVYGYEMDRKSWPYAWTRELWQQAQDDNELLDFHLRVKWDHYYDAWFDNIWEYEYPQACRDNAAWDYHHENFIAA